MTTSITIISTCIIGLETGLFVLLSVLAGHRLIHSIKAGRPFTSAFYSLTCVYLLFEIIIQIYQLVNVIMGHEAQYSVNMVLALNVFCIIVDQEIILMLTLLWNKIYGSFAGNEQYG